MLIVPRRFNATTSIITYAANKTQELTAQTIFAQVYLRGNGEGNLGYILGQCSSTATDGIRFFYDSASTRFAFGADSTGVALSPGAATTTTSVSTGNFYTVAFTWNGGLLSAGANSYLGVNGGTIAANRASGIADGSGSIKGPAGQTINIGNRTGVARTFDGDIFCLYRYNRVLQLEELQAIQECGPHSVPIGLVFAWYNGRDWGPFNLTAPNEVATGLGATSPLAMQIDDDEGEDDWYFGPASATVLTRSFGYVMG